MVLTGSMSKSGPDALVRLKLAMVYVKRTVDLEIWYSLDLDFGEELST